MSSRDKKLAARSGYLSGLLAKNFVKPIHNLAVSGRRVRVLSQHLSQLIPSDRPLTGLDVGCGSGELAAILQARLPQTKISGVDVLVRANAAIQVTKFDGKKLPFPDNSYDFTLITDVLHHTNEPTLLLEECARVSRHFVLIKDHCCQSWWDRMRLVFMDWVGNRAYNVHLPFNYQSKKDWERLYRLANLNCDTTISQLNLYPQPFSLIFDSNLHFITKLSVASSPKI